MPTATTFPSFADRTAALLSSLNEQGLYKHLQMLESPMDAVVRMRGHGECLCFCSNNYLGLANHPEVVEAGIRGLRDYGAGTASVRFICGTFTPHETLERKIAELMGTESAYTFVSAWTSAETLFPTACDPGDAILSDELNHACIIDSIRLTSVVKKGVTRAVYKHNDLGEMRSKLQALRANPEVTGVIWVVTDGVFSMEGDIADLPAMRRICDEFGAMLVVDDSHGHGVMGPTGRGTHEHWGMVPPLPAGGGRGVGSSGTGTSRTSPPPSPLPLGGGVDVFIGTLGKALGGGAGGFIAGPKVLTELLIQRGRPTLFSNALPVTVACSAAKAIDILVNEPQRVQQLKDNVDYARTKIREAGFHVLESPTAICPIIVHDTAKAIAMSKRLLELGVFVIGFGYPVVPEGHARLRVQISAAHTTQHIDALVAALKKL